VLRNTGIDGKDIGIIANMYWSQTAKMKICQKEGAFCHFSYSTYTLKKSLEKHWRNCQMSSKSVDMQSPTLDMPTTQ